MLQLEVRGLSKVYAGNRGLLSTTFTVGRGEIVAIVGRNGAGKSTLLKLLAGWLVPSTGRALVNGIDIKNRRALVRTIGFIPEIPNLFDMFTVQYNLGLFARLFDVAPSRTEQVLKDFGLIPFRRNRVETLSKGLKQRVSIARALLADPSLLLFDEPTSGLDFTAAVEVQQLLQILHAKRKTILFTSHQWAEVSDLATRVLVLDQGALVFDGTPAEYLQTDVYPPASLALAMNG